MAAIGHFLSGKGSGALIEGTFVRKSDWDLDSSGDDIDTTTFESLGFDQGLVGIIAGPWTIKGGFDASINDFDDPPGFFPRDDMGAVKLYLSKSFNSFHSMPANRVLSAKTASTVKGMVTIDASCKTNGIYALASGSY